MSSAKKRSVDVEEGQVDLERGVDFLNNLGPGGHFFRYTLALMIIVGMAFVTLLTMVLLPYFTGGRFQNPVSKKIVGILPIQNPKVSSMSAATPAPRVVYPLPTGAQSWILSRGEGTAGPAIGKVTVDPLTPAKGGVQTITASITNSSPVTKASVTLFTDHETLAHDLSLSSGTNTNGTWVTTWNVTDSYDNIYHINFDLQSSTGNWTGALTFRYP